MAPQGILERSLNEFAVCGNIIADFGEKGNGIKENVRKASVALYLMSATAAAKPDSKYPFCPYFSPFCVRNGLQAMYEWFLSFQHLMIGVVICKAVLVYHKTKEGSERD